MEGADASWRQYLLFENYWHENVGHAYGGVRTAEGETYVEYESGEKEYYDLRTDPWQLQSEHDVSKYPENAQRIGELSAVLSELKSCARASCRSADGNP